MSQKRNQNQITPHTAEKPVVANRIGLRLIKGGAEDSSTQASNIHLQNKKYKSRFAQQLDALAGSLEAEVEMLLKL